MVDRVRLGVMKVVRLQAFEAAAVGILKTSGKSFRTLQVQPISIQIPHGGLGEAALSVSVEKVGNGELRARHGWYQLSSCRLRRTSEAASQARQGTTWRKPGVFPA